MQSKRAVEPDSTAVRVALWRAIHVEVDPPPHVLEDEVGLELAARGQGRAFSHQHSAVSFVRKQALSSGF